MKILQVHTFYRQPGGEDQVYAAEHDLLTRRGHSVIPYEAHNDSLTGVSNVQLGTQTIWNHRAYSGLTQLLAREKPDLVHAHNTFPAMSPAIYYAAARARVPVVQTLHNYRLLCPNANFFRDGAVCEECLCSAIPYRAVTHACYRRSRTASAATVAMLTTHRLAGTWTTKIRVYIALTDFSRQKFIEGGLPAGRIVIKPNFLSEDPGVGQGAGTYALFAGRITEEKGIRTLLEAWRNIGSSMPLKIAGDGPMRAAAQRDAQSLNNVEWLGHCERTRILDLLKSATFLIFPSLYYESLPLSIIESFGCGTPVIASDLGVMRELVTHGVNGMRFTAGDPDALVDCVRDLAADSSKLSGMRHAARLTYLQNYTADRNYHLLLDIYDRALGRGN